MDNQQIQPIALCFFRRENQILVAERYDGKKKENYYRPLGGGLMFGEYSWDTIRREIKEEIGEEIKNLTFIGQTESICPDQEHPDHEIIFMFEGEFVNKSTYTKEILLGKERDGEEIRVVWKPISEFRKKKARFHPEALLDYLNH
ncbi:MAG: NUDIX domain-containing protein [Bacteroidota bacterium]